MVQKKGYHQHHSAEKLTEQQIVTYDSNDHMFIVHREVTGLPNI